MADQTQACLFRGAPALTVIALEAAGHNIVPSLAASLYYRNHVIESEILGRALGAAILAGM